MLKSLLRLNATRCGANNLFVSHRLPRWQKLVRSSRRPSRKSSKSSKEPVSRLRRPVRFAPGSSPRSRLQVRPARPVRPRLRVCRSRERPLKLAPVHTNNKIVPSSKKRWSPKTKIILKSNKQLLTRRLPSNKKPLPDSSISPSNRVTLCQVSPTFMLLHRAKQRHLSLNASKRRKRRKMPATRRPSKRQMMEKRTPKTTSQRRRKSKSSQFWTRTAKN